MYAYDVCRPEKGLRYHPKRAHIALFKKVLCTESLHIDTIKDTCKDTITTVVTSTRETGEVRAEVGLHKGSSPSTLFFIIIMDVISDDNGRDTPWSTSFADDLVLCEVSRRRKVGRLEKAIRCPCKSQQMENRVSYHQKKAESDSAEHTTLPQKVTFKYLGATIHQEQGCRTEMQAHTGRN